MGNSKRLRMVPRRDISSCALHQRFNDYLQLLVFTGCEFTANIKKCFTLRVPLVSKRIHLRM